jgi:hypothetical protein
VWGGGGGGGGGGGSRGRAAQGHGRGGRGSGKGGAIWLRERRVPATRVSGKGRRRGGIWGRRPATSREPGCAAPRGSGVPVRSPKFCSSGGEARGTPGWRLQAQTCCPASCQSAEPGSGLGWGCFAGRQLFSLLWGPVVTHCSHLRVGCACQRTGVTAGPRARTRRALGGSERVLIYCRPAVGPAVRQLPGPPRQPGQSLHAAIHEEGLVSRRMTGKQGLNSPPKKPLASSRRDVLIGQEQDRSTEE